jgi:hypothetical protein
MKAVYLAVSAFLLSFGALAQGPSKPTAKPAQQTVPQSFDLARYGVRVEADSRLIVVMAALEVAGFDPTPGKEPSVFRQQMQRDLADINPELRRRLKEFFDRGNKTRNRKTPAEQAAPYISMTLSLSPVPELLDPPRATDLPGELLDVLDFAPLLREFYRRSGIADKLPEYIRSHQAAGDALRPTTNEMVTELLGYLHTKPQTVFYEQIKTESKVKGKGTLQKVETRERERRFYIIPDLLAVPGTINFRNVGDDYYAIVQPMTPMGVDNPPNALPRAVSFSNSEMRRAYLQFVLDPLVLRYGKEISALREGIKKLLDARTQAGADVSPDIFLAVTRSLVAAADAKQEEFEKAEAATRAARIDIEKAKDTTAKLAVSKNLQTLKQALADESATQISDAYERGAVLAFYFAEQFKGLEESEFDIASSLQDMLLSFDAGKEEGRLAQFADARKRALAAREERRKKIADQQRIAAQNSAGRDLTLARALAEVEGMIGLKNFDQADERLSQLLSEHQGEPRILYARGRVASLAAQSIFDEKALEEKLGRAAAYYRAAILNSNADTDSALLSLAHVALGRILEFNQQSGAALREYEAAAKIGEVSGGAYKEAMAGKARLGAKPQE